MLMSCLHWTAFFRTDLTDCIQHSAIPFDCCYFGDNVWYSNFPYFTNSSNRLELQLDSLSLFGRNLRTLSLYVQMSIWRSSQQLESSSGCESERDQWLQFIMVLLGSHIVGKVWSTTLFDVLGKCCLVKQFWQCCCWYHARTHIFLFSICICLSPDEHSVLFVLSPASEVWKLLPW